MLPVKCIRIYAIKSLVLQPDGAQSYRNKTRNLASELKIKVTDTYYSTQISPTVTMPHVSLKSAQRLLRFDLIWLHRRQVPGYPASNWIAVSLYFPDRKEGFWSSVTSSPAVCLSLCAGSARCTYAERKAELVGTSQFTYSPESSFHQGQVFEFISPGSSRRNTLKNKNSSPRSPGIRTSSTPRQNLLLLQKKTVFHSCFLFIFYEFTAIIYVWDAKYDSKWFWISTDKFILHSMCMFIIIWHLLSQFTVCLQL